MTRGRTISMLVSAALAVSLLGAPPAAAAPPLGEAPTGRVATAPVSAAPLAAAAPAGLATAAPAGLVRRTATVSDVRTNASPTAAQRVSRVTVTQDVANSRLTMTATFAGTPSASASASVFVSVGVWDGSRCSPRTIMGGSSYRTGNNTASGAHINAAGAVTSSYQVTRTLKGSTLTVTSGKAAVFRTSAWECAWATVLDESNGNTFQDFYAERLAEVHAPALSVSGGAPVQGARAGKWLTMRLDVRNAGRGPAKNVRITAKGSGMTIKKASRSLGTIDDRSTEYGVTYKVRLKGAKSRKIRFTVTADGGYRATKTFTIAREPAPKRYSSLAGRYFWGFLPASANASSGWDNTAMYFQDRRWVYVGDTDRVRTCRTTTKTCKRYTYDARRGIAKIGSQKFKVTTKGFSYRVAKGEARSSFAPATLAKKGTRIKADLIHQNWSGYCLLTCTAWTDRITLAKNGRFVTGRLSVGSWPGIGASWASAPKDKRGTYRVVSKGVVELRYANGRKKRMTLAIDHDVRGKASAAGAGIILGTKNYYLDD